MPSKHKLEKKKKRLKLVQKARNLKKQAPRSYKYETEKPVYQNKTEIVNTAIGFDRVNLQKQTVYKEGRPELVEVGKKKVTIKHKIRRGAGITKDLLK